MADTTAVDSVKVDTNLGRTTRDSAAGYVVALPDEGTQQAPRKRDTTNQVTVAGDTIPKADSAKADSAKGGAGKADSVPAAPAMFVKMAPGRPKRDSMALIYALRKFDRTIGWPVKGPAPKPGAILPNKRVIAYYGNPLSKKM